MSLQVHIDDFLGRTVADPTGKSVGRIQEVRVEREGNDYVVSAYLVGVGGLLERLGLDIWPRRSGGPRRGYVARWDQVDLSDPRAPRLKCPASELEKG